jgi:hypothetical protein
MKRSFTIVLIAVMCMLIALPASSQIFGIGVKGGLNFANLRGDFILDLDDEFQLDTDLKNSTGFIIGASFRTSLLPFISLQPEILYTEKGAKFEESMMIPVNGSTANAAVEATIDLKYLEVPLLVRAGLPVPGFSPFVYLGPAIAFNLSADFTMEANVMGFSMKETEDIKDEIKNIDYGLVVGGGLEFGLPLFKLHVEARYTMGLTNVLDNGDMNGDIDLKNGVFSLMVGATF